MATNARPLIRLSRRSYATLKALSKETGKTMSDLAGEAIDRHVRERFLEAANREYARWTPAERRAHQEELAAWDATLMDGLESEDWGGERRAQSPQRAAALRRVVGRPPSLTRSCGVGA